MSGLIFPRCKLYDLGKRMKGCRLIAPLSKSTNAWMSNFDQLWPTAGCNAVVVNSKSHLSGFSTLFFFFFILFYVKMWGKQRIDIKSASYPGFSLTTKRNSNQQLVDIVVEESPLSLISETKWSNVDTSRVSPVFFE